MSLFNEEYDEERSDFACIECGEEMNSDDVCDNEECELFGSGDGGYMVNTEGDTDE